MGVDYKYLASQKSALWAVLSMICTPPELKPKPLTSEQISELVDLDAFLQYLSLNGTSSNLNPCYSDPGRGAHIANKRDNEYNPHEGALAMIESMQEVLVSEIYRPTLFDALAAAVVALSDRTGIDAGCIELDGSVKINDKSSRYILSDFSPDQTGREIAKVTVHKEDKGDVCMWVIVSVVLV